MLKSKKQSYESIEAYFEYITDTYGYPKVFRDFKEDYVVCNDQKIHLDLLISDQTAPNVIFIPGTAMYSLCYAEILHQIYTAGYNVIGIDPVGHGRSDGERGVYTFGDLLDNTKEVVKYVQTNFNNRINLFGTSQGGIVAFYLAAENRTDIHSAICHNIADLAAPDVTRLSRFPGLMNVAKPLLIGLSQGLGHTMVPISSYLDMSKIKVKHFGNAQNFLDGDPLALHSISVQALRSLATTELPQRLEDITTPLFVFQGDQDTIFPVDYTESLFNQLNCKKKLRIYPGLNHAAITEEPERIAPEIIEWLKDIEE